MKKLFLEILFSIVFVVFSTIFVYGYLAGFDIFWNSQFIWSSILALGWVVVSLGYYNQGWIIHKSQSSEHVSIVLPIAVFIVQCILFVKGIFYHDWSLITGAVMVNSGVVFSLYQIIKARNNIFMSNLKENKEEGEHYICLGGCKGVSKKPGTCQAPSCAHHDHALVRCYCTDGKHNNFQ